VRGEPNAVTAVESALRDLLGQFWDMAANRIFQYLEFIFQKRKRVTATTLVTRCFYR